MENKTKEILGTTYDAFNMAANSPSELFQNIKPICVTITKNPSKENLKGALNYFNKLNISSLKDAALLEYVTFPFKLNLKRGHLNEEQEILIFQCLQSLLQKTDVSAITEDVLLWGFNAFSVYFTTKEILTGNTDEKNPINSIAPKSEEQKIEVVKFLLSLLEITTDNVFLRIYHDSNLPLVGHIVAVLLNLAERERNIILQVSAIYCLKSLTGYNVDYKLHHIFIGDFFASFFPGMALSFNNLLTSGKNLSSKVVNAWLDAFQFVLFIIFCDRDGEQKKFVGNKDILSMLDKPEEDDVNNMESKQIKIVRNKKWLKDTTKHMETVFDNVLPVLMTHTNLNTRKALLEFLDYILSHCMDTLMDSVPCFLDIIAKLSSDGFEEIKNKSIEVLDTARLKFHAIENHSLHVMLQERLKSYVLSLPRIMNGSGDDVKLAHLHIIKGYMVFFGKHFQEYLYSSSHLEMFFSALLQVLEIETKNVKVVEERTNIIRQAIGINGPRKKQQYHYRDFRYFNSSTVLIAFRDIIKLIAVNSDIDLVIDHLLSSTMENPRLRLQTVFVLNEVISCCKDKEGVDTSLYVDQVTETYLQECFWKLPVTNDHLTYSEKQNNFRTRDLSIVQNNKKFCKAVPFEILNSNIQLICMMLEGMAIHAMVLCTNYNIFLMKTLYPILEKVGCVNAAVSRTASQVLIDISESTNYESVGDLLLINSDYLLNAITLQFRHLVYGTAAPCVLAVILKLCNSDILPIICDVMEDVFRALDEYQEEVANDMLNVLKYFAMAVDKWYNSKTKTPKTVNKNMDITDINNDNVTIHNFMCEYLKLSASATGNVEENDDIMNDIGNLPDEHNQDTSDKKKEIPLHYQIVITSLKKCDYFVSAHDDSVKLKALDVVYYGVIALRERENDLLPALHKVWPTIMQRLKEDDMVIVLKALDAVCCMVTYSGDFLRKRLSTEFIPFAIKFLKAHQKNFTKNKSQYTQIHKVINKLISFLSDILQYLDISLKLFCEVATACLQYMNCQLHKVVQLATIEAMIKLYHVHPDAIWLLLSTKSLVNESLALKFFPKCNVAQQTEKSNVYADNISKVFVRINVN